MNIRNRLVHIYILPSSPIAEKLKEKLYTYKTVSKIKKGKSTTPFSIVCLLTKTQDIFNLHQNAVDSNNNCLSDKNNLLTLTSQHL